MVLLYKTKKNPRAIQVDDDKYTLLRSAWRSEEEGGVKSEEEGGVKSEEEGGVKSEEEGGVKRREE